MWTNEISFNLDKTLLQLPEIGTVFEINDDRGRHFFNQSVRSSFIDPRSMKTEAKALRTKTAFLNINYVTENDNSKYFASNRNICLWVDFLHDCVKSQTNRKHSHPIFCVINAYAELFATMLC